MLFLLFASAAIAINYGVSERVHSTHYDPSQELVVILPNSYEATKNTAMILPKESVNSKNHGKLFTKIYETNKNIFPLKQYKRYRNGKNNILKANNIKYNGVVLASLKLPLPVVLLSDSAKKNKIWLRQASNKRIRIRSVDGLNRTSTLSKNKQQKAHMLAQLLKNNAANRRDDDNQDDNEDGDDELFKSLNKNQMKWEEYQTADGASIMELIALNTRHKTNRYR